MKNRIAIETKILTDADAVAQEAAKVIAAEARAAVAARRRFVTAVSGGHTPCHMLRAVAHETVPWESVHVLQVDERIAPAGAPDRNLTQLRESLLAHPRDSTESTKALSLRVLEYYALPLLTRFRSHSTLAPALMLRPPVVRGALNERRGWH